MTQPTDNNLTEMRFCDLAKGARFKYPDSSRVWVVLENYPNSVGLIVSGTGAKKDRFQSHCCFVGDDWTLESKVSVLGDVDDPLMAELLRDEIVALKRDLSERYTITAKLTAKIVGLKLKIQELEK